MILCNPQSKKKIKDISLDNFYVVADFDKTLSTKNSKTTMSLFGESGLYGEEYNRERRKNYEFYRPLELDPSILIEEKYQLMKEWQEKSYQLMVKNKVRESDIQKILSTTDLLQLREGSIEFIQLLNSNHIPLIINSAGCGNFIIELLKQNNCYSNQIYIHSNILKFRDDVVVDKLDYLVHSMNKYDIEVPTDFLRKIKSKKYSVIIGDQISDLKMATNLPKDDVFSFGFLESNVNQMEEEFMEGFDVVLKQGEGFLGISKILTLKK